MAAGYAGKLLFADLTKGTFDQKPLSEEMARSFIGGYGIGARILYDMMKPGTDPLGPDNVLGFVSGPLNGTGAFFGGRYTVVCKSPVTGEWNDANSGGFFGPELKKAGFDAIFVSGVAKEPVYIFINDGKAEIRDAKAVWGRDCTQSLEVLVRETGEPSLRAALIGPAGEKQSLMACVINDKHRAAGRGGCGAVMGSKNLKAVVARGTGRISVADGDALRKVNCGDPRLHEERADRRTGQIVGRLRHGRHDRGIRTYGRFADQELGGSRRHRYGRRVPQQTVILYF